MLLLSQFRDPSLQSGDFPEMLRRMRTIVDHLSEISGNAYTWYSKGWTLEEAFLYPAWNDEVASNALISKLKHKYREDTSVTSVGLWNGLEKDDDAMTITCRVSARKMSPDELEISFQNYAAIGDTEKMTGLVSFIAKQFDPEIISVEPRYYVTRQVFEDRPGVGWMLYLPRLLTAQQVPEAGKLTTVEPAQGIRPGTIVISEPDAVFSLDNPEHIGHANRIEICLAEIDAPPRYEDLLDLRK
jgi:hypothetical protein